MFRGEEKPPKEQIKGSAVKTFFNNPSLVISAGLVQQIRPQSGLCSQYLLSCENTENTNMDIFFFTPFFPCLFLIVCSLSQLLSFLLSAALTTGEITKVGHFQKTG